MPADYSPPAPDVLDWVRRHVGARDLSTDRMHGGITAAVDRVTAGSAGTFVLKRWTDPDTIAEQMPRRELAGLEAVVGTGIPAPAPVAADPEGTDAGVPCLLMTHVPGAADLAPQDRSGWLTAAASMQARIHDIDLAAGARAGLGRSDGWFDADRERGWITDPGLRRAALAAAAVTHDRRHDVLVHGDYQPFNLLWDAGRLRSVVDWTVTGRGQRGIDVGHCRLNLAVLWGPEAAASYLANYERAAGVTPDLAAQLRALLTWHYDWRDFIPRQVAGRAEVDLAGMADRVAATIRATLDAAG